MGYTQNTRWNNEARDLERRFDRGEATPAEVAAFHQRVQTRRAKLVSIGREANKRKNESRQAKVTNRQIGVENRNLSLALERTRSLSRVASRSTTIGLRSAQREDELARQEGQKDAAVERIRDSQEIRASTPAPTRYVNPATGNQVVFSPGVRREQPLHDIDRRMSVAPNQNLPDGRQATVTYKQEPVLNPNMSLAAGGVGNVTYAPVTPFVNFNPDISKAEHDQIKRQNQYAGNVMQAGTGFDTGDAPLTKTQYWLHEHAKGFTGGFSDTIKFALGGEPNSPIPRDARGYRAGATVGGAVVMFPWTRASAAAVTSTKAVVQTVNPLWRPLKAASSRIPFNMEFGGTLMGMVGLKHTLQSGANQFQNNEVLRFPDAKAIQLRSTRAAQRAASEGPRFEWKNPGSYVITGDRWLQSLLPVYGRSKAAAQASVRADLTRHGLTGDELDAGVSAFHTQRMTNLGAEGVTLLAALETRGELAAGRQSLRGLQYGLKGYLTKKRAREEVADVFALTSGRAGVIEGSVGYAVETTSRGGNPSVKGLVGFGAGGGVVAAGFGRLIGQYSYTPGKAQARTLRVGRALDFPGEYIGDKLGEGVLRVGRRTKIVPPTPKVVTTPFGVNFGGGGAAVVVGPSVNVGGGSGVTMIASDSVVRASSALSTQQFSTGLAAANIPSSSFTKAQSYSNLFSTSNAFAFTSTNSLSNSFTNVFSPTSAHSSSFVPSTAITPGGGLPWIPFGGGRGKKSRGRGLTGAGRGFGFAPSLKAIFGNIKGGTGKTPIGGFTGLGLRRLPGRARSRTKKKKPVRRRRKR